MRFILLLILLTITEMVRIEGTKTTSDLWITPKQRNVDTDTEIPEQKYQLHYSNSRLSQSEVDAMNIPEEKINQDQQKIRGKDEDTVKSIGLNVETTEPTHEHTDITSEDTPELTEITTEATSELTEITTEATPELTGITTEATPEHGQISNIRNEDKESSETEATYETIGSDSNLNELDNATKEAIQLEERKEIVNATREGDEKELVSGGIDNESEGVDGVEIDNDEVRDIPINMDVQDTGSISSKFEVEIRSSHPRIISYPDIAANEMIEKLEGDNQVFEELRRKIHYLEESMDNHKNNKIVDSNEVGEAQMILEIMDEKMLIPFSLTLESVKEQIIKMDHSLKGDALIYVKGYIKRAENFISEAQEKLNIVVETDKEWTNMDLMENSIEILDTEVIRDVDLKPENMDNLEVLKVNDIKAGDNNVDNEQVLHTEEIIIGLTTDDENMLNVFHDTILEEEINEVIAGEGTNEWKATESEEVVDEEFLNHPSYEKEDMSGNEINPQTTKEDMNSEYVILEKEINELMDEKRTNEKESVETFESKEVVHEDPDIDDKEDMSNNAINPQSTKEHINSEYVIFKKEINELIDEEKSVETLDKEDNISSNGITTKSTKEVVTSKYEHFDNLETPNEKYFTPSTEGVKQQINSDGFLPTPTEPTVTDTRDEKISNKFGDQVAAGKNSDRVTERPEDVRGAIERKMNPKIKLILETTDFLKTNEDQTHEHDFSKDSGSWSAELILPSFTLLILSSCIIWLLYTRIKKKQVVSLNDYGRLEIVSTLQNPNYNYYKLK